MLSTAQRLYRLAKERQKPNAQRDPGYQERDMTFFRQGLQALDRRYDPAVDKAEWMLFLDQYLDQPASERVAVLDNALGLTGTVDRAALSQRREKLLEGGGSVGRDRQLMDRIADLQDAWLHQVEALPEGRPLPERLRQARWMLEEYRISLWAQQLGTAHPVSDQRIRKVLG